MSSAEKYHKRKNMGDKKTLLTEGLSLCDDGKDDRANEMREVPPQGPRLSEDLGRTILFNENAA